MNDGGAQSFSRVENNSALFGVSRFRRDSSQSLIIRKNIPAQSFIKFLNNSFTLGAKSRRSGP
jgi:hypothetical protein